MKLTIKVTNSELFESGFDYITVKSSKKESYLYLMNCSKDLSIKQLIKGIEDAEKVEVESFSLNNEEVIELTNRLSFIHLKVDSNDFYKITLHFIKHELEESAIRTLIRKMLESYYLSLSLIEDFYVIPNLSPFYGTSV